MTNTHFQGFKSCGDDSATETDAFSDIKHIELNPIKPAFEWPWRRDGVSVFQNWMSTTSVSVTRQSFLPLGSPTSLPPANRSSLKKKKKSHLN